MILIETGTKSEAALMQATVLADQLTLSGLPAGMSDDLIPADANFGAKSAAIPFLVRPDADTVKDVIVLGCEDLDDTRLAEIRRRRLAPETRTMAIGLFPTKQAEMSAVSKLSYVSGTTPTAFNLEDHAEIRAGNSIAPAIGAAVSDLRPAFVRGSRTVTVYAPSTDDMHELGALQYLTAARSFTAAIYLSGKQKTEWFRRFGPGAAILGFSEVLPSAMARMGSVLVLGGEVGNNDRALALINTAVMSGRVIVDATPEGIFEADGLPVLRGPAELAYLPMYLEDTVMPNVAGMQEDTRSSGYASRIGAQVLFPDRDLPEATEPPSPRKHVHFMPTNGIGLGHAQRSSLIADGLDTPKDNVSFFAFPSCLPMIKRAGFVGTPLIAHSRMHGDGIAHDLANYARLRATTQNGDVFVFDGGYVFDSIYRTILDRDLKAVWIRRGLWKATQNNQIPLDREKFFARVIVPTEAFDSLNETLSSGGHVKTVGPIVRRTRDGWDRAAARKAIAETLGVSFSKLVVTMLGSGVVHDLSAHVQTVSNAVESRPDWLHLIVVWPSAVVPPERYAWRRSRVVSTTQASNLAAAADFAVSAAGYNSFHEALYNQVPTIFVPQTAEILDDQAARAEAADEAGLARHVPANKLGLLDRTLRQFLDKDAASELKTALTAADLPETGNADAARIIEELMT